MNIESIGKLLLWQLESNEWVVVVEDDYPDFKHFQAFKEEAPLGAFKRLDIILIAFVGDADDMEIRFVFYADPKAIGTDKRRFGKKTRENNFEALRGFCRGILKAARVQAQEIEVSMTPKSRTKINFGDGDYLSPAYEAGLVYHRSDLYLLPV